MYYWLAGVWLLIDSVISILMYRKRPGQTWERDHSVRVIRGLLSLGLMVKGYFEIKTR